MKIITSLFLTILSFATLHSQSDCEVINPDFSYSEATLSGPKGLLGLAYPTSYTLKVYFHIINYDNGTRPTAVTNTMLSQAITNLNTHYSQFNMNFVLEGSDEINNSNWMTIANSTEFLQMRTDAITDGLFIDGVFNVFICDIYSAGAGVATKPGITSLLRDEYLLSSSFPHEFGHNLSLHHTHHNWNNPNCAQVTLGDHVDDTERSCEFTPSEISNNCTTYLGSAIDGCGNGFAQLPASNFMSTNTLPCRSLVNAIFTSGQGNRIKTAMNSFLNTLYLDAITTETSFSIYNAGSIIDITHLFSGGRSYSIVTKDKEKVIDPNYINSLDNGLYVIKKNYDDGTIEEKIISKQ